MGAKRKRLHGFKSDEDIETSFEANDVGNGSIDLSGYDLTGVRMSDHPEFAKKDKAITLRLPKLQHDRIAKVAKAQHMPLQRFIRLAIEEKLQRTEAA